MAAAAPLVAASSGCCCRGLFYNNLLFTFFKLAILCILTVRYLKSIPMLLLSLENYRTGTTDFFLARDRLIDFSLNRYFDAEI